MARSARPPDCGLASGVLHCAILDDYQRVALDCADWQVLAGDMKVECFHDAVDAPDRIAARLAPFDIVVAMRERTPFPAAMLERLPALRLLVTTGARNTSIDIAAAAQRNIVVCGTDSHPGTAAELTWALILGLARQVYDEMDSVRAGGWQTKLGRSLHGATLGVIGTGRVGAQVAAIGRAFGMRVLAYSRSLDAARAAALGIERADTPDAVAGHADILTLHVPLTPATRGMIDARILARMKPDALLVNTARGPIVDECALLEALRSGRLAGAALDVFDREPLPVDSPLRALRNVLLTPHIGYVTRENYRMFYGGAVAAIQAWIAGQPIRVLNPG